ncbi:MAG: ABC transporter ATP-binding protein [Gemmatimonadetes bacterium]|jgi:ABC-2 type transport system ATP-binding protein|nr:ABC transporter ATP-binding protein [Gemmatimonadota bacterium]MBT6149876.1 ABC transporter ATP-binding protein [Gemmatimonadota bacterium]MBT7860273.1 ABC transporter ATP-binding protein [Gemmatimonadota bacterium]
MSIALRCTGMMKRYPGFQLGPIDLELETGVSLGLVGPNGAGKTTAMHCLTGLVRPEHGEREICGTPVSAGDPGWKADVAYVKVRQAYFEKWSGARNLAFLSQFYPRWSATMADELARRLQLPLDKRVRDLSRGNRVKLGIVAAVAAGPRLLLLDEPTAGLDPVVRDDVLGVLFDLLEQGDCAICYSTHILSDIARLADDLAFLVDGQIVVRATIADLVEAWRSITCRLPDDAPGSSSDELTGAGSGDLPGHPSGVLSHLTGVVVHERSGADNRIISCDGEATIAQLAELGAQHIRPTTMSGEEIALQILKRGVSCGD